MVKLVYLINRFEFMGKTAILLGATGLTGNLLLKRLLDDDRYDKVKLFSRSAASIAHSKIEEHLIDLFELEKYQSLFTGDEVFCCVGTTTAKTPDKAFYKKIDYDIPLNAAKLCKVNQIPMFIVISALGANPDSRIFYNRLKGEMEAAVLAVGISQTYILQPSLISGYRKERRMGEWIAKQLMKLFNIIMIGPMRKYRSIHPDIIAKAMISLANNPMDKKRIESEEIKKIAKQG